MVGGAGAPVAAGDPPHPCDPSILKPQRKKKPKSRVDVHILGDARVTRRRNSQHLPAPIWTRSLCVAEPLCLADSFQENPSTSNPDCCLLRTATHEWWQLNCRGKEAQCWGGEFKRHHAWDNQCDKRSDQIFRRDNAPRLFIRKGDCSLRPTEYVPHLCTKLPSMEGRLTPSCFVHCSMSIPSYYARQGD